MDVIVAYLETMFAPYPKTARFDEAKTELRAMMEDKYTELRATGRSENEAVGQVITEFGNLAELADALGISQELDATTREAGAGTPTIGVSPTPLAPQVTMAQAQGFSEAKRRTQPTLAIAVALLVISPIPVIALTTLAEISSFPLGDTAASAIGIPLTLLVVFIGVALLIGRSRHLSPFSQITEGSFTRNPAVSAWALQQRADHEARRTTSLIIAVGLWILAASPVIVTGLISDQGGRWADQLPTAGVCLTLLIVAAGLAVYLPAAWASSVAETLTAEGDANPAEAANDSLVGVIAAIYWPSLVAIYLAWSFIWDAWDRSWIIWPIAGVLFGAIAAGVSTLEQYRKNRNQIQP